MGRRIATALGVVSLVLVGLVGHAGAHEVEGWIQDIEGDANFLNGQGLAETPLDPGTGTGGAQLHGADIRAIRFATDYVAIPIGDDGIDYQATGVTIEFVTEATPRSDGPTTIYRLNVNVDGICNSFIQAYLRGETSLPEDPEHRMLQWRQLDGGCPDGATSVRMPVDAAIDDDRSSLVMRLPYDQLTEAQRSALDEGSVLFAPQGNTRTNFTWGNQGVLPYSGLTAPQIDATVVGDEWIVGQDMPEDVPCTLNCPGEAGDGTATTTDEPAAGEGGQI